MSEHIAQRDQPRRYAASSSVPLGMWRYQDLLPPVASRAPSPGWTPLIQSKLHAGLFLKDEAALPTGTHEVRGTAMLAAAYDGLQLPDAVTRQRYRMEGLKTLGYEIIEQLDWSYPDAILSLASDAMHDALLAAFSSLEQMGWIQPGVRPRMIAVASRSLSDEMTLQTMLEAARREGILLAPQSAAAFAAYQPRLSAGEFKPTERVVLINTGIGFSPARTLPTSMPVGGIITPV